MSGHIAVVVSGSVCAACLALAGCAAGSSTGPAATGPAATGPAATGPALSSPSTPAASSPARTGYLTVTISGLPSHPTLAFGGAPLEFTVTLRNATDQSYRDITPLVSIGHSTASTSPARMAPAGTLAELDRASGSWRPVVYDREGTGMDYIMADIVQQPAFTLGPGQSASFRFRIAFSAGQGPMWLPKGQTPVNVTLIRVPARTWIGNRPAASVPIATVTR